jgi:hypothetical protein
VLSPYHQSRASGKVVDDGGVAVGVLEMDLQCKGEQLECEEDLGRAASLSWLCTRTPGCLDFIPVSNVCHHDDLLLDLDPPYRSHPPPLPSLMIDWGKKQEWHPPRALAACPKLTQGST